MCVCVCVCVCVCAVHVYARMCWAPHLFVPFEALHCAAAGREHVVRVDGETRDLLRVRVACGVDHVVRYCRYSIVLRGFVRHHVMLVSQGPVTHFFWLRIRISVFAMQYQFLF